MKIKNLSTGHHKVSEHNPQKKIVTNHICHNILDYIKNSYNSTKKRHTTKLFKGKGLKYTFL